MGTTHNTTHTRQESPLKLSWSTEDSQFFFCCLFVGAGRLAVVLGREGGGGGKGFLPLSLSLSLSPFFFRGKLFQLKVLSKFRGRGGGGVCTVQAERRRRRRRRGGCNTTNRFVFFSGVAAAAAAAVAEALWWCRRATARPEPIN